MEPVFFCLAAGDNKVGNTEQQTDRVSLQKNQGRTFTKDIIRQADVLCFMIPASPHPTYFYTTSFSSHLLRGGRGGKGDEASELSVEGKNPGKAPAISCEGARGMKLRSSRWRQRKPPSISCEGMGRGKEGTSCELLFGGSTTQHSDPVGG